MASGSCSFLYLYLSVLSVSLLYLFSWNHFQVDFLCCKVEFFFQFLLYLAMVTFTTGDRKSLKWKHSWYAVRFSTLTSYSLLPYRGCAEFTDVLRRNSLWDSMLSLLLQNSFVFDLTVWLCTLMRSTWGWKDLNLWVFFILWIISKICFQVQRLLDHTCWYNEHIEGRKMLELMEAWVNTYALKVNCRHKKHIVECKENSGSQILTREMWDNFATIKL
jgi:hypothetical protein